VDVSRWFRTYGFAEVFDDLLIGAYPLDHEDVGMLNWQGIDRVMNLVEDAEYRPGERESIEAALALAGIEEQRISFTDYGRLSPEDLESTAREVSRWLDDGKRIYLHCRAGWQRSAAVAAAVVALRDGIEIDDALAYIQRRKPSADPLPHQLEDLHRWWDDRGRAGVLDEGEQWDRHGDEGEGEQSHRRGEEDEGGSGSTSD
jgi:protein-tyrosine phosphatase